MLSRRIWLTVSKAPFKFSYKSEAITPFAYAARITSVTSLMASSVERYFRLPIYLSGSSRCDSAALAIRSLMVASITLPIVLSREIGL